MNLLTLKARAAGVVIAFFAILMVMLAGTTTTANVVTGSQNSFVVRSSQTWYVYAQAGETVSSSFVVAAVTTDASFEPTIVVTSPDGVAVDTCSLAYADPVGTACDFSTISARAGVWDVSILGSNGTVTPNEQGQVFMNWAIEATESSGAPIPGRVWSESFSIRNTSVARPIPTSDLSLWYVSGQGYIYNIVRVGFNGIDAQFSGNAFGNVMLATCASAHSSSFIGSPTIGPIAAPACTYSPYKIFFEEPATELPASVTLPDGSSTWLLPTPVEPRIAEFSLVQDAPGSRSGTVEIGYSGFEGTVTVLIDTDGDGAYVGSPDREARVAIVNGIGVFDFDGADDAGIAIPITTPISFRLETGSYGEVHFLDHDVEHLAGGVRVARLNGPDDGTRTRIFWDDTHLTTDNATARCVTTPGLVGLQGMDSSAGVHGWDAETCAGGLTGGTWGDDRFIDNWGSIDSDQTAEFILPAAAPSVTVAKSSAPATGAVVVPGQEVTYTLTYQNTGDAPGTVKTVDDLSDVLDDATLTGLPVSDTAGINASVAGSQLSVTGGLAAGATVTVTYTVTVDDLPNGNGKLANTVVGPPGSGCEAGFTNQSCGTVVDVRALEILKSSSGADGVMTEGAVAYTVTVTNIGAASYTADDPATFSDDLTAVLDDAVFNADLTADIGDATYAEPVVSWSGPLDPGQVATITYSMSVNAPISGDGVLDNTVLGPPESNCGPSEVADECATSDPIRGFEVSKAVDATGEVKPGDTVKYTIAVTNTGAFSYPSDDPAGFNDDLTDVLDDATYNNDVSTSAGSVEVINNHLVWEGPLPAGGTAQITYSVTVNGAGNRNLENVVVANERASGACLDKDSSNCTTHTPIAPNPGGLAVTGLGTSWMFAPAALGLLLLGGVGAMMIRARRSHL